MIRSEASVPTRNARRYLRQLRKHWSHKFPVTHDETTSAIPFSGDRTAELVADQDRLRIRLSVADEAARERMPTVIEEHLDRFAFRETLFYEWRVEP